MTAIGPPDEGEVRQACRLLEGQTGVLITGDLRWFSNLRAWALPVRLRIQSHSSSGVPETTEWYLVMGERFPFGKVKLFPARTGGLSGTWPHQSRNVSGDPALPWTDGDICISTPTFVHRRQGDDPDPVGQLDRLRWYTERALMWLVDAAAGTLMRDGEYFELPHFSPLEETIGFCEDTSTFASWTASNARHGHVELTPLAGGSAQVAKVFFAAAGEKVVSPSWGISISESTATQASGWLRLDSVPIHKPYEAIRTWTELWRFIEESGLNPEIHLRSVLAPLRDNNRHALLIGFPIPIRVGETCSIMHWQPVRLPSEVTSTKPASGFRGNEQGLWSRDKTRVLQSRKPLVWLGGENWNPDVLGARGRLSPSLRHSQVALIGAGALGSAVGELLVRGGLWDIHVVDPERLNVGNLVRHTLSLEDVGQYKAERLAQRLNRLSPFARASFSNRTAHFERREDTGGPRLILDCTGSDDVLEQLSAGSPEEGSLLASFSVGLGARRLYCVCVPGMSFAFSEFRAEIQPWLKRDLEDNGGRVLSHDGPGCWHPLFPARSDEISIHAAAAVSELERMIRVDSRSWNLRVLERRVSHDGTLTYGAGDVG